MLYPHIRWAIRRDMPEILSIERDSFVYPWSEEDFVKTLRITTNIGMVAEVQEKIAGYMIYELHKNRLHLLNLAVGAEYRRQKVGTALMNKLVTKLSPMRRNKIRFDVSEDNLRGHLFLKGVGFHSCGVERNFYKQNDRDAYKFVFRAQKEILV